DLPVVDDVFVDAVRGGIADRHPHIHTARNRLTYDANNASTLNGTLVRGENDPATGDQVADSAHQFAGLTYDCYQEHFGRDSYNNSGASLRSVVHYGQSYNNAFWNGSRMVYGDGDGNLTISLALSQDVVTHELTHAVTEY